MEKTILGTYKAEKEIVLSTSLDCEIYNSGKNVAIHLAEPGVEGLDVVDVKNGLWELAKFLKNDKKFAKVEKITATSWINTEHPAILKRLGFTVVEEGDERDVNITTYRLRKLNPLSSPIPLKKMTTQPGYAEMSKEAFIELYFDARRKKTAA